MTTPTDTRTPLQVTSQSVATVVEPYRQWLHSAAAGHRRHSAEWSRLMHAAGNITIALLNLDAAIRDGVDLAGMPAGDPVDVAALTADRDALRHSVDTYETAFPR